MKRKPTKIKLPTTQKKFAAIVGVSQATVSNWVSLRVKPEGLQRKSLQENFPEVLKEIEEKYAEK